MTMYDVIFESLQSDLEAGKITEEEAVELNEAAFKKYSDVDVELVEESTEKTEEPTEESTEEAEEELSLEEACELINLYLEGSRRPNRTERLANVLMKQNPDATINGNDAEDLAMHKRQAERKIKSAINNVKSNKIYLKRSKEELDKDRKKGLPEDSSNIMSDKEWIHLYSRKVREDKQKKKDSIAKAKEAKQNLENLAFKKESVTETKLNIYEAFESGTIDADEKTALLGLLADE